MDGPLTPLHLLVLGLFDAEDVAHADDVAADLGLAPRVVDQLLDDLWAAGFIEPVREH